MYFDNCDYTGKETNNYDIFETRQPKYAYKSSTCIVRCLFSTDLNVVSKKTLFPTKHLQRLSRKITEEDLFILAI